MTLSEFVDQVYVPAKIVLSARYKAALTEAARKWSDSVGRPVVLQDFSEPAIATFLSVVARRHPATTVNSYRRRLLSIWEQAAESGFTERSPRRQLVRSLPEQHDAPEAWDEGQIIELVNYVMRLPDFVGDVPACHWWLSLFLSIYWTSNRISAMLAVESKHYDGKGILVRKQKNKRPQWFPLPESCREVIERTRPETRELIWAHPWHPRTVWTKARQIIEAAGLPAPRTGLQLFHRLRRTTITMCASVDPAVAQRTAGHLDYATTEKSYIDPRLLQARSAVDILPDPLNHTSLTPALRIFG